MQLIAQFGLFNGFLVLLLIVAYSFRRSSRVSNRIFLGLSIFFVWYTLFVVVLTLTGQILNYPGFHRTGIISSYLAIPFLYIYSRNTFYPGKPWRKTDWILLLPAVVYLVDYLPFFTMPSGEKIAVLRQNLESNERIFLVGEGWMGLTGLYFSYVWVAIIMYFQCRLIIVNAKLDIGFKTPHNHRLFIFIVGITLLYLPIFIPGVIGILFRLPWFSPNFVGLTFGLSLSAVSIYLFISPRILYGFLPEKRLPIAQSGMPKTAESVTAKSNIVQTGISREEIAAEAEVVLQHMKEQKPYLKPGFTLQDLSNQTGIPVYQLSPLINGHFKTNFANWVNRFRIEYFIGLVPDNPQLTLEALSNKAGFISRSTFINAFKKEKGLTPREYFKGQKVPA
jgi:AraC-like DNA-binding protein